MKTLHVSDILNGEFLKLQLFLDGKGFQFYEEKKGCPGLWDTLYIVGNVALQEDRASDWRPIQTGGLPANVSFHFYPLV